MTQNDIAFYNARKQAKDARLKRRETKRHDLAQEATERTKAAASYLSAQASTVQAEAAKQNAATNRANYELDYSREYGVDYGSDFSTGYYLDVSTGETVTYDVTSPERTSAVRHWSEDRDGDIIVSIPTTKNGVPQTYMEREMKIAQYRQGIKTDQSQLWKNIFQAAEYGAGTIQILVDTGSNLITGKDERNRSSSRKDEK